MGAKIYPSLTFNGNCEEAFNFYKSVFGGEFSYLARFKEMPKAEGMPGFPQELNEKVMHVALPIGDNYMLSGNDYGDPRQKLIVGNNMSILIYADTKEEADRLFKALSAGGKVKMPMAETFWNAYYGIFVDKFGIEWMINVDLH